MSRRRTQPSRPSRGGRLSPEAAGAVGTTLAGLVLRLLLWSTQSIPSVDGITYIGLARGILAGRPAPTVHQFGYPLLILAARPFCPDWIVAARVVDLMCGVLLIPLVWLLTSQFVKRPWLRLLPALLVAVHPLFVRYSLTTMTEAPYLVLLVLMFMLVATRRPLLGGLAGGAAYAVRPEALIAAVAVAVFLGRRRSEVVRFGLAVASVTGLYVTVVGMSTGKWTLSPKTANIAAPSWVDYEPTVDGPAPAIDTGERLHRFGADALRAYPGRLVSILGIVVFQSGWVPAAAAVPAVLLPGGWFLAAGLAQLPIMGLVSQGTQLRFFLANLVFLWILAAVAMDRWRRVVLRRVVLLAWGAGVAVTAAVHLDLYSANEDGYFPELRTAGRWLGGVADGASVVYSRKPYTAFYAGVQNRTIPLGNYEDMMDYVVAHGGDFLVADEFVIRRFRGQFTPLVADLATIRAETRVTPVYVDDRFAGRRTILYRINRPGGRFAGLQSRMAQLAALPHGPNHRAHGVIALQNRNPGLAAEEFALALRDTPNNAEVMALRAQALLHLENGLDEAVGLARAAMEIDPDNPVVQRTAAMCGAAAAARDGS